MFSWPFSSKQMLPFIISLALFMEAVDTTIINTAIPSIARSLNIMPMDLKMALISYLLILAIFIPISGWVADKFGMKRVFIGAMCVFTLSSFWCGMTNHLYTLILARMAQGLGGALMLPVGRLIILRVFERHEVMVVMNRMIMVAAFGLMLGPVLGGLITHYFSWHWIFWVNIPVGIFTILMVIKWLEDIPRYAVPPLDKLGFILFGTGLAALIFGMSALSEPLVNNMMTGIIFLAAILLLGFYVLHSHHRAYPIVNVTLFRIRTFQIAVLGNLFARLGFGGMPFLLPLLLQVGLGRSAQESGLLIAPMAVGVAIVRPLSVYLLRVFGFRRVLILNTVIMAVSLASFVLIKSTTPTYVIPIITFSFGCLAALQYGGINSLAYADIAQENLSAATSIMSTMQQVAQSVGVGICALFIHYFSVFFQTKISLLPVVFYQTFLAIAMITLISTFLFVRLKNDDGYQMIKKSIVSRG